MRRAVNIGLLICLAFQPCVGYGQEAADSVQQNLEQQLEKADLLLEISAYDSAIATYRHAANIARKNGRVELALKTEINLAEVLRKTHQYEPGLELLESIKDSEGYPLMHARKLGRIAAILHEGPNHSNRDKFDTIRLVLDQALAIAVEHDFELEEASLRRELGYLLARRSEEFHRPGFLELVKAAALFNKHNDLENYTGTIVKILEHHIAYERYDKADSVSKIALSLAQDKDWHALKIDLYGSMAQQSRQLNDTGAMHFWQVKATYSHLHFQGQVYTSALSAYKVLYETEEYRDKAEESAMIARLKSEEVEQKNKRLSELILLLSLLGVAVLAALVLFIRERKLKARLKVAKEKYEMLNIESNHRIKNNLQMVTSLIKYAKKEQKASGNTTSLDEVSTKIQTVSALHKHLHLDVHNDFVNLGTYFQEVVRLYNDLSPANFKVKDSIHQIQLRSERIVYFGLLFNEMLTNTLEHSKAELNIELTVERVGGHYSFAYQDNSPRPSGSTRGTGSVLIEQLIHRVEGSKYAFDPQKGRYQFEFHD